HSSRRAKSRLHPWSFSAKLINMINGSPTPEQIAAEARAALRRRPRRSSREHFRELVRLGWINARGQVTKLLGGEADPEPDYPSWTEPASSSRKKKRAM